MGDTEGLVEFELKLLRSMVGLEPALPWGAAVGAALEALVGHGLVEMVSGLGYTPTEKGVALAIRARRRD